MTDLAEIQCITETKPSSPLDCLRPKNAKFTHELTPFEFAFIEQAIIDPSSNISIKIQSIINDIMADGKVDMHDVPKIVLLISTMYKEHLLLHAVSNIRLSAIVKYTLYAIMESKLLPIPEIVLPLLRGAIDSSILLLEFTLPKIKQSFFPKIRKSFFRCCS